MRWLTVLAGVAALSFSCSTEGAGRSSPASVSSVPAGAQGIQSLVGRGRKSMVEKRYEDAVTWYGEACRQYPKRVSSFRLYGRALFAAGHFRESSAAFQTAIERHPRSAHIPHDFRNRFPDGGHFDARLAELERKVREDGSDEDLSFLLAYIYHLLGRSEEAAPLFRRLARTEGVDVSPFLDSSP